MSPQSQTFYRQLVVSHLNNNTVFEKFQHLISSYIKHKDKSLLFSIIKPSQEVTDLFNAWLFLPDEERTEAIKTFQMRIFPKQKEAIVRDDGIVTFNSADIIGTLQPYQKGILDIKYK